MTQTAPASQLRHLSRLEFADRAQADDRDLVVVMELPEGLGADTERAVWRAVAEDMGAIVERDGRYVVVRHPDWPALPIQAAANRALSEQMLKRGRYRQHRAMRSPAKARSVPAPVLPRTARRESNHAAPARVRGSRRATQATLPGGDDPPGESEPPSRRPRTSSEARAVAQRLLDGLDRVA